MLVRVTLGEIYNFGAWDIYCDTVGLNRWCLNEGMADSSETVCLTPHEVKKFGLLRYVINRLEEDTP